MVTSLNSLKTSCSTLRQTGFMGMVQSEDNNIRVNFVINALQELEDYRLNFLSVKAQLRNNVWFHTNENNSKETFSTPGYKNDGEYAHLHSGVILMVLSSHSESVSTLITIPGSRLAGL